MFVCLFFKGKESKREMPENEPLRFEWKGIWQLWLLLKPCSAAAKHTGPQRCPASKHTAAAAAAAKSLQSCPTLCDPIDGSPPGFPVPQAHYSPQNTKREMETISTGHSSVLTVASFQAEGQRHLTISGAWDRARGPRHQDRDPRIKRAEGGRKC